MVKQLDLEEQEQLDQLKHFWKQYGNYISGVLIVVFGSIAAWNGYQYWQRSQAVQAAVLFDELDRAAQAADVARLERSLSDMQSRFGRTTYAQQAGLLAAKVFYDKGKPDAAQSALRAVAERAQDPGYQAIARLRLSALLLEGKDYGAALAQVGTDIPPEFAALAADRTGDILLAQGKKAEAIAAYQRAYKGLDERAEYRRLVEVKLNALGLDPKAAITTAALVPEVKK